MISGTRLSENNFGSFVHILSLALLSGKTGYSLDNTKIAYIFRSLRFAMDGVSLPSRLSGQVYEHTTTSLYMTSESDVACTIDS